VNRDQIANTTEFSDWADADGFTPAGGLTFTENSLVLGYSIALGSGNGTNEIYLGHLRVGGVTYDFSIEVLGAGTPSTYAQDVADRASRLPIDSNCPASESRRVTLQTESLRYSGVTSLSVESNTARL
jgi:hypothetical protein